MLVQGEWHGLAGEAEAMVQMHLQANPAPLQRCYLFRGSARRCGLPKPQLMALGRLF